MIKNKPNILFLFTKEYPFGTSEQYLFDEINVIALSFDKIVLIPTELFNLEKKNSQRKIPENVLILDLNLELSKVESKRSIKELIYLLFKEFVLSKKKYWLIKNLRKHMSIANHQLALVNYLEKYLSNFEDSNKYFYAYWLHHSCVILGILKKRKVISNFIARGHSIDLYDFKWSLSRYIRVPPFYYFKMNTISHLFAVSQHGAKTIGEVFPRYRQKVTYSYLGVNDSGLNPVEETEVFTIVTCSNFSDNKRVYLMPDILKHLKTDVRWIHFGGGQGINKVEAKLKELPSNIKVDLKGYTPNNLIKDFYRSTYVNLFINLSEAEGLPVSLMEAISFGIPVMATDVYGNPEIANEYTGFKIPFNFNEAETASKIELFAKNEEDQYTKRKQARKFYLDYFQAEINYTKFVKEIYKYPG